MNLLCQKYISEAKSYFPIMGRNEKKYLYNLAKTIEDYCETEHVSTMDDIYKNFGKPQSIITSYIETGNISLLIKNIQLSKCISRGLLFLFVLASIFISITTYKASKALKQEQIS